MRQSIIAVMAVLCLSIGPACSDLDFKHQKDEVLTLAAGEDFQAKVRGLPEPNKYQIVLITSGLGGNWSIQKRSAETKLTSFSIPKTLGDGITDADVVSGEIYTYSVGQIRDRGFVSAKDVTIQMPRDIVVEGTSVPKNKNPINLENEFRIFIKKDSVLKTMGLESSIVVSEIYSEPGGRIETFASNDTAAVGERGRASGKFYLKVGTITGPLTIAIRGERGGQGLKGMQGSVGSAGTPSKVVTHAGFQLINSGTCNRQRYQQLSDMDCFSPPPNRRKLSYEECRLQYHPGVGGKGGAGGPGFAGYVGADGGEASDTSIEIEQPNKDLKIIFEPGVGGIGGTGGDGGEGGSGGAGGEIISNPPGSPCDPSPEGPSGNSGPKGPAGPVGLPGKKGKLIFNGGSL